jgi:hypothetical protein
VRCFIAAVALTLAALAGVSGPSASAASAAPAAPDRFAARSCVCPYYIYDDGARKDGSFGARSYYTTLSVGTPGHFVVRIHGYELTRERLNLVELFFDRISSIQVLSTVRRLVLGRPAMATASGIWPRSTRGRTRDAGSPARSGPHVWTTPTT